jgi:hypothetical protein
MFDALDGVHHWLAVDIYTLHERLSRVEKEAIGIAIVSFWYRFRMLHEVVSLLREEMDAVSQCVRKSPGDRSVLFSSDV